MPAALEPGKRFSISLMIDAGKDPLPVFHFPYLTGRQQRRLLSAYEAIGSEKLISTRDIDAAFNLLREYLIGWENLPIPFDGGSLEDMLSLTEVMELINRLLLQAPSFDEKKS